MRHSCTIIWGVFVLALAAAVVWMLNLQHVVQASIASGHLLDWVMGALCLLWLAVILKVPWDLYFQAHAVLFELQRSRERGIATPPGRDQYVRTVRHRLGWLAVGAHVASALLIAAITFFTGGRVGYFFAAFYLIATLFRPVVAACAFLTEKLRSIAQEIRYPREDVVEMRARLEHGEQSVRDLNEMVKRIDAALSQETANREVETRAIRQNVHAIGREFESTVSHLTDNQDIIRGIRAFVRLVASSAESEGA